MSAATAVGSASRSRTVAAVAAVPDEGKEPPSRLQGKHCYGKNGLGEGWASEHAK